MYLFHHSLEILAVPTLDKDGWSISDPYRQLVVQFPSLPLAQWHHRTAWNLCGGEHVHPKNEE